MSPSLASPEEIPEWRLLLPEAPWASVPDDKMAVLVAEHKEAERRRKEEEVKRFLVRHRGFVGDRLEGNDEGEETENDGEEGDGETGLVEDGEVGAEERGREEEDEIGGDGEEQGEKDGTENGDEQQETHDSEGDAEDNQVDDAQRDQPPPISECCDIDRPQLKDVSAPTRMDPVLSELNANFNTVLSKFVTAAEGLRDFNDLFQKVICESKSSHNMKDKWTSNERRIKDVATQTPEWEYEGRGREFETSVGDAIQRLKGLIRQLGAVEKSAGDGVKDSEVRLEEGRELEDHERFQDANEGD
ncbi:uncharacterized protein BDZ99DRAFT_463206 [Mytilinidion resinicola]|uniref:Uncharacterized protein n=1 Tax=Mytilinidion resinicola TaxID=574789 RepID=A0A6A6YLE4_9PEZI|nr:uncharacterized protein BDZ99DRAFT_463206 [Mytilinidion resinicola]KAF2809383.1 hypothetical protein BDZ99DRAFT_463206 [Mytilinidion resinicola]